MNLQQMIAVGVFLLVMAAIISEKVHRSVAALAGAVVLLLTHVLTIETAADYVDLNTIGVLVGMMLFVAVVKSSGLFEYIAIWSAKLTRGQPMAILAVFAVITAVLSAFLDNVTTADRPHDHCHYPDPGGQSGAFSALSDHGLQHRRYRYPHR